MIAVILLKDRGVTKTKHFYWLLVKIFDEIDPELGCVEVKKMYILIYQFCMFQRRPKCTHFREIIDVDIIA